MASNEIVVGSSDGAPATEPAGSSSLNAVALRERRRRRKLRLKKLEKRLEVLDRHIKKWAKAEVSLEDMNSGFSAYMKEDLLKRKFVQTWQELCELQHLNDSIVIEDEEASGYEGTPYPEVNRRVQRLLRLDEFPDYVDVVQLLDRCNSKYDLRIAPEERGKLARKVFKDVGRIMKRSRHRDFVHHFGSHLTDNFTTDVDPAETVYYTRPTDLLGQLVTLCVCVCVCYSGRGSAEEAAGEPEGGGEEDAGRRGGVCGKAGAGVQRAAVSRGRLVLRQRTRGGGGGG